MAAIKHVPLRGEKEQNVTLNMAVVRQLAFCLCVTFFQSTLTLRRLLDGELILLITNVVMCEYIVVLGC